jgi:hypothetical protein
MASGSSLEVEHRNCRYERNEDFSTPQRISERKRCFKTLRIDFGLLALRVGNQRLRSVFPRKCSLDPVDVKELVIIAPYLVSYSSFLRMKDDEIPINHSMFVLVTLLQYPHSPELLNRLRHKQD